MHPDQSRELTRLLAEYKAAVAFREAAKAALPPPDPARIDPGVATAAEMATREYLDHFKAIYAEDRAAGRLQNALWDHAVELVAGIDSARPLVESIKTFEAQPGQIVLIKVRDDSDPGEREELGKLVAEHLPDNLVIMHLGEMELSAADPPPDPPVIKELADDGREASADHREP